LSILKTSVAVVFVHALPEIRPILVISTITDKTAETIQFVIFGDDVTMGRFDRFCKVKFSRDLLPVFIEVLFFKSGFQPRLIRSAFKPREALMHTLIFLLYRIYLTMN
jgi:hypothetical protein